MGSRLFWLSLGLVIGFIVGYIVRSLREIRDGVLEVEKSISKREHKEDGLVRYPYVLDVVLLLVVALTVWASITSQIDSNKVQRAQDKIDQATSCNKQFLSKTITALNERTAYAQESINANVELQKSFNVLVGLSLHDPPISKDAGRKVVETFHSALSHFLEISSKASLKAANNPFPTTKELQICLDKN